MCDALHLDARGSLNSGGRPFHGISWTLVRFDEAVHVSYSDSSLFQYVDSKPTTMSDAMSLVISTTDLNVYVPMLQTQCEGNGVLEEYGWNACWNSTFLPSGQYEMDLTVKNWIGGTSRVTFSFEKRNVPVPAVQIANGQEVITDSSQGLFLQGSSTPSECTSGPQPNLEYSWTVSPPITVNGAVWTPPRGQILGLSPYTLPSGNLFTFTFTASAGTSAASASVHVHVKRAPPIARLAGGDRLISLSEAAPSTYTLDASSSESTTAKGGNLFFFWTCSQNLKLRDAVIGSQKFDCALITSVADYQGSSKLVLESEKLRKHSFTFSPDLKIPSYTTGCDTQEKINFRCDPTVAYVFAVTVCDADIGRCTDNTRLSGSDKVVWSTSRQFIPEVLIKAQKTTRISSEFNAVAEGGVGGGPRPRYLWVQLGPEGSELLEDPSNLLTAPTAVSLVMKPRLLKGADR